MTTRLDDIYGNQGGRAFGVRVAGAALVALLLAAVLACSATLCGFGVSMAFAEGESGSASSVSSAAAGQGAAYEIATDPFADASSVDLADGLYNVEVLFEGGSGKATVESPAEMEVFDGRAVVRLVWSSPYYDYVIVSGKKYLPVNEEGNSEFVVPVTTYDEPISIIGDTTAMSEAHEIDYTITVSRSSVKAVKDGKRVAIDAAAEKASSESAVEAQPKSGASWPWIMFAICAVLSVICIASSIVLVHNYNSREAARRAGR